MKRIQEAELSELSAQAAASGRRRANRNLHDGPSDAVQRFLNAFEPGSYVRPHRHGENRWELFVALRGRAAVLVFDERGCVRHRIELGRDASDVGVELPAGVWHTVAALEPGTVLFELKPGPYHPPADKDFAAWAPQEGGLACDAFATWFRAARPGDGLEGVGCPNPEQG